MSSDFFKRGRARFDVDRKTKELRKEDASSLEDQINDPTKLLQWQQWVTDLTHWMTQHIGMLDHHRPGYDRHVLKTAIRKWRRFPPLVAPQGNRVHILKFVDASYDLPKTLVEDTEHGHVFGHTTLHLCRLSNSPYSIDICFDVLHIVLQAPPGYVPIHPEEEPLEEKKEEQTQIGAKDPTKQEPTKSDHGSGDSSSSESDSEGESDRKFQNAESKFDAEQKDGQEWKTSEKEMKRADRDKYEKMEAASTSQPQKKKARRQSKKQNEKMLPVGWQSWDITHTRVHPRIVAYKFPLMTMSGPDPRANGDGRKDACLHADWVDHGGCFHKDDAKMYVCPPDPAHFILCMIVASLYCDEYRYMPLQEGLLWNHRFIFACTRIAENSGLINWEWPDLQLPFHVRNARAISGYYSHESEKIVMECRAAHSTRTDRSTSTFKLMYEKFNRYDLTNAHTLLCKYVEE